MVPAQRHRLLPLLIAIVAGLVLAGVAGADTRTSTERVQALETGADTCTSFTDPAGDGGNGLDITRVDVCESQGWLGQRELEFTVTLSGHIYCSSDGDGLQIIVALDLDQNPDTGSAFYGTEVEFAPDPIGDAAFLRASGWDFRGAPGPGLGWECGPHTQGYFVDGTALGLAPDAGFNFVVATLAPHPDTAPDIGTYHYQPVPGPPPPALGPDTRPPHVLAFPSSGVRGKLATISYWALDGRGKTADTIRIYRRARLLATIRRPLRDSNPFDRSSVRWRVPRSVHDKLRFSVRSADAAGNIGAPSWASIVIR